MNILLITQLFPYTAEVSYTSGALREFAEEWGNMGHFVKVLRPHYGYEKEAFPDKPVFKIGNNLDVEFIKPLRIPLIKLNFYSQRKALKKIPFKPDVIICHQYNSYFTFHTLARKFKVPLVIGIHMSDIRISKNRFHHWHQERIFKQATAFACRSYTYERLFQQQFPAFSDRTFVALSGLPERYLKLDNTSKKLSGKFEIVTVSSLIKRKQIDKIIKALTLLPSNINWNFSIIGSGDEEEKLKNQAQHLNLSDNVKFCGQYNRDDVIRNLLKSDIFILPSYDETLGLAYLEAMACGCITIGSENEGIDGIIVDGENGFLCDPFDDRSISIKLLEAVTLKPEHLNNILENVKKTIRNFSIRQKSKEYFDHVNTLIK
jgi:glycosyltransferase involved in cell wall biosynthesis